MSCRVEYRAARKMGHNSWVFLYKLEGGVMGAALSVNLSWWLLSLAMFAYVLFGVCPLTWHGFSIDAFFGLSDFPKVSIAAGVMLWFIHQTPLDARNFPIVGRELGVVESVLERSSHVQLAEGFSKVAAGGGDCQCPPIYLCVKNQMCRESIIGSIL